MRLIKKLQQHAETSENTAQNANDSNEKNDVDKRLSPLSGNVLDTKYDKNDKNVCGFKVEKPKMPKFSGDVREYAIFVPISSI